MATVHFEFTRDNNIACNQLLQDAFDEKLQTTTTESTAASVVSRLTPRWREKCAENFSYSTSLSEDGNRVGHFHSKKKHYSSTINCSYNLY